VKRGDLALIAVPGAYGKPRPALIIQSSLFTEHPSITVCLLTSHIRETPLFRFLVEPAPENGLTLPSQVQIDKIMTLPRDKVGQIIGSLSRKQMYEITRLLALWIGMGDD